MLVFLGGNIARDFVKLQNFSSEDSLNGFNKSRRISGGTIQPTLAFSEALHRLLSQVRLDLQHFCGHFLSFIL